jgi:uncharacterized membrane-anchored protein YhcB (DUF1043 family)
MEVFAVALVVSLVAPAVMSYLTNRNRRQEKREDWDRQDAREKAERERQEAVAAQAAEAARLLVASNKKIVASNQEIVASNEEIAVAAREAADSAKATAEVAADTAKATSVVLIGKLDTVHTLVNQRLTDVMEQELVALEQGLFFMRKSTQDEETNEAIAAAEQRIKTLRADIGDRARQAALAAPGIEQTEINEENLNS